MDLIRKILLLGDIGVGKTSIAERLVFDRFTGAYKVTIGTDIYRYEVTPSPQPGQRFHFLVCDTDGNFASSIFREVSIRGAHAAMIVGDVTRRATLDHMVGLAEGFLDAFPGRYSAFVVNKLDLIGPTGAPTLPPRLVSGELPLFRTSAMTGQHVKAAFDEAAAAIVRRRL